MTMFKPKQCQNCGKNDFCITETIKYIAHLDRKSKQMVTDSVMESNIDLVFCINCGTVQEKAEFEMSTVKD
jgi:Zn ribbon nucleic-acid-binding protein